MAAEKRVGYPADRELTREQDTVIRRIFALGRGAAAVPVTISAIHRTFADMDVRDLVGHLTILIDAGLIGNARPAPEKVGNEYRITADGIAYCSGAGQDVLSRKGSSGQPDPLQLPHKPAESRHNN